VGRQLLPGCAAIASGFGIYLLAAFASRVAGAGLAASVLIEESLKTMLAFALSMSLMGRSEPRAGNPASARDIARCLSRREAALRGLGFGLVASAAFALAENCAYSLSFPGSGIFARLWWSTPVHLLSSSFAVAGLLPCMLLRAKGRWPERVAARRAYREGPRNILPGSPDARRAFVGALLGFAAAFALHLGANLFVLTAPSPRVVGIAGAGMILAVFAVQSALARRMYIGGIIHG
jgi:hypothetical protein